VSPDVFLAVWALRIIGALVVVLGALAGSWWLVEKILRWVGVYWAFREWFWRYAIWRARREKRPGEVEPHRCWCGHEHKQVTAVTDAFAPKPLTTKRSNDGDST
jgi:hypothetical protein